MKFYLHLIKKLYYTKIQNLDVLRQENINENPS